VKNTNKGENKRTNIKNATKNSNKAAKIGAESVLMIDNLKEKYLKNLVRRLKESDQYKLPYAYYVVDNKIIRLKIN
jgi:phosphopantetheine adenylyltransferase